MLVRFFRTTTAAEGKARGYCAEGTFADRVTPFDGPDGVPFVRIHTTRGNGGPAAEVVEVPAANVLDMFAPLPPRPAEAPAPRWEVHPARVTAEDIARGRLGR